MIIFFFFFFLNQHDYLFGCLFYSELYYNFNDFLLSIGMAGLALKMPAPPSQEMPREQGRRGSWCTSLLAPVCLIFSVSLFMGLSKEHVLTH